MVFAVLIHDGEALDPLGRRAGFGDVDDAGVEIALLAGDALIDGVGDLVGDAAPGFGRGEEGEAGELLLDHHVPQPELDAQPPVGLAGDGAGDQPLGVEQAPVGETGQALQRRRVLNERRRIDRPEQTRALEVGRDHLGDALAHLERAAIGTMKGGDGDRNRLDHAAGDVDMKIGAGRRREGQDQGCGQDGEAATRAGEQDSHQSMSFGLKVKVMRRQVSYFSGGSASGWQRGFLTARSAASAAAR